MVLERIFRSSSIAILLINRRCELLLINSINYLETKTHHCHDIPVRYPKSHSVAHPAADLRDRQASEFSSLPPLNIRCKHKNANIEKPKSFQSDHLPMQSIIMCHHLKFAIYRIQIGYGVVSITITVIIYAYMPSYAMKITIPHATCYRHAIAYVAALAESFIKGHAEQVNTVVKRANEEVNLTFFKAI